MSQSSFLSNYLTTQLKAYQAKNRPLKQLPNERLNKATGEVKTYSGETFSMNIDSKAVPFIQDELQSRTNTGRYLEFAEFSVIGVRDEEAFEYTSKDGNQVTGINPAHIICKPSNEVGKTEVVAFEMPVTIDNQPK